MSELVIIGFFAAIILLHIGVRRLMFYAFENYPTNTARKILIVVAITIPTILISTGFLIRRYYGS